MYALAAPKDVDTAVFTELPERLRKPAPAGHRGHPLNFLEGPSFDREGNLYCVDIPAGRVYRISPKGDWDIVTEYDGTPNGLKIHKDGRIFIADRKNGVVVLDPKAGTTKTIVSGPEPGKKFRGLNDLMFDKKGGLWFTDQGRTGLTDLSGIVYKLDLETNKIEAAVKGLPSPNGLVFNLRESELFIAVTRASAVWRTELADPELRSGLYVQLPCTGPDGLALDMEGNVAIAHPGPGNVALYSKWGVPLCIVKSCRGHMTTNIAYGGLDNKTLYVVESHTCSILTAPLPVAGKLMYSHA